MKTDESYSDYMLYFIDTICKKFGPRYSCSQAEKNANIWIKKELDEFCDETFIDEFETRPALYPQGFIKVAGILGGISPLFMPLIFPFPIISLILVILGITVLYSELFLMKEWIGFLFKVKKSSNVFGIIKPTEEVKFRIIFEGHTDSAKEMNIANFKSRARQIVGITGLYFLFHTIILSLWKVIYQLVSGASIVLANWGFVSITIIDLIYFIPLIIIYPFFFLLLKGFLGKTVVLGANDNLSASAVAVAIGKHLSENKPKNVEVWIGSQGSEEVGDKGAKAFVEKYGEMGILDKSYTVVLECTGAAEDMCLIEKDMHRAEYNSEINNILLQAHTEVKRKNPDLLNIRTGSLKIGSCDACRYIHKGFKAAALMGMVHIKNRAVNWHSVNDAPENISKKVLSDFLDVSLKFVEIVDERYAVKNKGFKK
ncbi:MAG: M28 family peptidase [Candidatus Lokiarchaeota archaeon]|nr:M28 family peptidase [Candidatus Lokiarchaeota archaeon]